MNMCEKLISTATEAYQLSDSKRSTVNGCSTTSSSKRPLLCLERRCDVQCPITHDTSLTVTQDHAALASQSRCLMDAVDTLEAAPFAPEASGQKILWSLICSTAFPQPRETSSCVQEKCRATFVLVEKQRLRACPIASNKTRPAKT